VRAFLKTVVARRTTADGAEAGYVPARATCWSGRRGEVARSRTDPSPQKRLALAQQQQAADGMVSQPGLGLPFAQLQHGHASASRSAAEPPFIPTRQTHWAGLEAPVGASQWKASLALNSQKPPGPPPHVINCLIISDPILDSGTDRPDQVGRTFLALAWASSR